MARGPTLKQRRFVEKYLETGNGSEAARVAYNITDPTGKTAGVISAENLAKPRVIALLESYSEFAASRVRELAGQDKHLPTALGASKDILDRAGYKPVEKTAGLIEGDLKITWGE